MTRDAGDGRVPDFGGMTRQELFDWMNGQLQGSVHAAPGLDDTQRVDFPWTARQCIAFFRARADPSAAQRLQRALDLVEAGRG